jgi:hypothetical protein
MSAKEAFRFEAASGCKTWLDPRDWPTSLPPIEYGPDDLVRKVQQGGQISLQGRNIRLSKALVGQPVALRPCLEAEGLFKIYFCHQPL